MPKRFFFACAMAAAALAACSNNANNIYGTPATPTPIPSYSPNPAITTANVTFTVASSPIPNQPIAMSTPDASGQPGTPIATVNTNSSGVAAFTGLSDTATYCWTTMYTPTSTPPPQPQKYTACASQEFWAAGVHLGNP